MRGRRDGTNLGDRFGRRRRHRPVIGAVNLERVQLDSDLEGLGNTGLNLTQIAAAAGEHRVTRRPAPSPTRSTCTARPRRTPPNDLLRLTASGGEVTVARVGQARGAAAARPAPAGRPRRTASPSRSAASRPQRPTVTVAGTNLDFGTATRPASRRDRSRRRRRHQRRRCASRHTSATDGSDCRRAAVPGAAPSVPPGHRRHGAGVAHRGGRGRGPHHVHAVDRRHGARRQRRHRRRALRRRRGRSRPTCHGAAPTHDVAMLDRPLAGAPGRSTPSASPPSPGLRRSAA